MTTADSSCDLSETGRNRAEPKPQGDQSGGAEEWRGPTAAKRAAQAVGYRISIFREKVQNDGAEDARYCWAFFNTYTETYTLSHLMEIKPIKQRAFGYNQTT